MECIHADSCFTDPGCRQRLAICHILWFDYCDKASQQYIPPLPLANSKTTPLSPAPPRARHLQLYHIRFKTKISQCPLFLTLQPPIYRRRRLSSLSHTAMATVRRTTGATGATEAMVATGATMRDQGVDYLEPPRHSFWAMKWRD